jgi:hypothetical protein
VQSLLFTRAAVDLIVRAAREQGVGGTVLNLGNSQHF